MCVERDIVGKKKSEIKDCLEEFGGLLWVGEGVFVDTLGGVGRT